MDHYQEMCIVFPFTKINANGISAVVASLEIHEEFTDIPVFFPPTKSNPENLEKELSGFKKILLAVSVFSMQLDMYKKLIALYRKTYPEKEILVIAGGPHASGDPFSMLVNGADIACTGEGELVIRDVIHTFATTQNYQEIRGIAYLEDNKLVRTAKAETIDLNEFPPFSVKHGLVRPIEITRGCAWKCRFCQIRSRGWGVRHRSPANIEKYVAITKSFFPGKRIDIRFISPNALSYGAEDGKTLRLDVLEEMLSRVRGVIGEKGNIFFGSFPSEVRPETITEESVQLLKEHTDSKTLIVGGQSGSQRVLDLSDRGHSPEETVRAVRLLIDAGFQVDVDLIFGLPGEEDADVVETIEHMKQLTNLGAKIHSHTFMPLVGTPFASAEPGEIHKKYQIILPTYQGNRQLKGQHDSQAEEAQRLAKRREVEKELRKGFERVIVENNDD